MPALTGTSKNLTQAGRGACFYRKMVTHPPSSVARLLTVKIPPPQECRGILGTPCRWQESKLKWKPQKVSAQGWSWVEVTSWQPKEALSQSWRELLGRHCTWCGGTVELVSCADESRRTARCQDVNWREDSLPLSHSGQGTASITAPVWKRWPKTCSSWLLQRLAGTLCRCCLPWTGEAALSIV